MGKILHTPFLASVLLMGGAFIAFRISPWRPATQFAAQAQAATREAGYYGYGEDVVKRVEEEKRLKRIKQGILSLADETVANRLQVRPEAREKAKEVLSSLQKRTEQKLEEAFKAWKREAGNEKVGAPRFMSPSASIARELDDWKARAEQEIFDVLTPKERLEWEKYAQPALSKKALSAAYAE